MKAAILTIGDEILNGQTVDTNSSWLGKELNNIGVSIVARLSVSDTHEAIMNGLDIVFQYADMVIATGGLGPTKDDVTKKALADYFKDELVFDQGTFDRIVSYFEKSGRKTTNAHHDQSFMPSKAQLLINSRGTAPGMWFEENEKILLSMPGVPTEMKGLMLEHGLERIASLNNTQHISHFIIQTAGLGETYIAEAISEILEDFPSELSIAYLPGMSTVKLRVTGIGPDKKYIEEQVNFFGHAICHHLDDAVFGLGDISLPEVVGIKAKEHQLTIGSAESCTGGHIAHLLTTIAGSSEYFKGSVVSYDNEVKTELLGVKQETLDMNGAVSAETVTEMSQGALKVLDIDVAVAVSGIAGPSGGSADKPVGTIWIAVANKDKVTTKKIQLAKNRLLNIKYTSLHALNELRKFIMKEYK